MRGGFLLVSAAVVVGGCSVTPVPLERVELSEYASDKRARVVADQEPVRGAIGLYEAMARALKYNLDKRVEEMKILLKEKELRVAHFSLLPKMVANTGFADRDNYAGGQSVRILTPTTLGTPSLVSSTSSERAVRTADLSFSWHILDFGLSYVRAKQAADQVLIAEEARRRIINRLAEDVRVAYWKAVTATRLMNRLRRLEGRVLASLRGTQALSTSGVSSPLTALTYERELVEVRREIRRLAGDLATAKAQLAALINIDPGSHFTVRVPRSQPAPGHLGGTARDMVDTALRMRSELRDVAYRERINSKEAEAAILQMLPGIGLNGGPNWNSNSFLFNNNWVSWGAQASWNLMNVFSYPARREAVEAQGALLDQRALAVTMAIMTQVHVSRVRLIHARRKYRTAEHFHDVQSRILRQIRQSLEAGKVSEQTAIREEMNALVARVKLDLAYVELQSAFSNVYASMGLAPYIGVDPEAADVQALARLLRGRWVKLGDKLARHL